MAASPKGDVILRAAGPAEAEALAHILTALRNAGLRRKPGDAAFALAHYIAHSDRICCTLALDPQDRALGFQSVKRAQPGNPYDTPPGWGIVGTHVHPDAARRGIGRLLFAETCAAARAAGIAHLDAPIGATNAAGLAFYDALGFTTRAETGTGISKRFDL